MICSPSYIVQCRCQERLADYAATCIGAFPLQFIRICIPPPHSPSCGRASVMLRTPRMPRMPGMRRVPRMPTVPRMPRMPRMPFCGMSNIGVNRRSPRRAYLCTPIHHAIRGGHQGASLLTRCSTRSCSAANHSAAVGWPTRSETWPPISSIRLCKQASSTAL